MKESKPADDADAASHAGLRSASARDERRARKAALRMLREDPGHTREAVRQHKNALRAIGAQDDGLIGDLQAIAPKRAGLWTKEGAKHGWYIPAVNTYPGDQRLFEGDLGVLIRDWILPGHRPPAPILDEQQPVVTIGSCFARNLRTTLAHSGVNASRFWIPSGLNNTFAILDFFSWCITGEHTGRGFSYERGEAGDIREWTPEAERGTYLKALAGAGAFVFTIGLAEVWQDRDTGGVFWRGIPNEIFDANRHVFRLSTVDENAANLRRVIALIRQVNPAAPIVLTLSPVPLLATFREISCLTADCVSKSVLRVALDQVMADALPHVYYWPSFEIVKWVGANLPWAAYKPPRNPSRELVRVIIDSFLDAYYTPDAIAAMRRRRAEGPDPDLHDEAD